MSASLAPPIALTIAAPATMYNERGPATATTPESDALFAALASSVAGRGDPERDARLDLVASELSNLHARGGALDDAVVDFALHAHGVVEPAVQVAIGTDAAVLAPQLAD